MSPQEERDLDNFQHGKFPSFWAEREDAYAGDEPVICESIDEKMDRLSDYENMPMSKAEKQEIPD